MQSNKTKWIIVVAVLVIAAVAGYVFFANKGSDNQSDTSAASKLPAKDRIVGLGSAQGDLKGFVAAQFEIENAECKQKTGKEVAMGLRSSVADKFAVLSIGCDEGGTAGYAVKQDGMWRLAFKAEELPTCDQVNAVKFTKEIIPECETNGNVVENQNP